jgi:ABC-type Co2+ transport system permease subunit
MTVIVAIQVFAFQDGGVLALGANVFNMAVIGVFRRLLAVLHPGTRPPPCPGQW